MKVSFLALAAACACLPALARAATYSDNTNACHVTVPDNWTRSPMRASDPSSPHFYARVRATPDGNAVRAQITAMGGQIVNDNAARTLATARVANNRLYWVVTKTTPACWATVEFSAGQDAQARTIAESTRH